jgi:hypothetical protein
MATQEAKAPAKSKVATKAKTKSAAPEREADDESPATPAKRRYRSSVFTHALVRNFGACFLSMLMHMVLLIVLALCFMPAQMKEEIREVVASLFEEREDDLLKIELEEQVQAATEVTAALFSSAPAVGAEGGSVAGALGSVSAPSLDNSVVESDDANSEMKISRPAMAMPSSNRLIASVPDGTLGDPRAIVDDYAEAMDRITQELMWMLDKGPVLVIWAFDQSESMKDDQQEIRDRIDRVYIELGLTTKASGDRLATAVTSYGAGFLVHTPKPTSDRTEIRAAIESVPVDPSGKEMMCQAVGRSVTYFQDYARGSRRQVALILVTDESGDRDDNNVYLEQAIAVAKGANCRIYTLGREAVFGYPYVHIRWVHPQTRHVHWIAIDRGPETAFVEQLQTDGFRRRYDAFNSGFGPYEETRMSRETGGIFFMLPSLESALVRGEKRRYELEAMRSYKPDLRQRMEVKADIDKSPLRSIIEKVIYDLNPYNPAAAKIIEMRMHFTDHQTNPQAFLSQARTEQQKALIYLTYLAAAQKALENHHRAREQETSPRWQGNYDLIYAQLIAYQARIYEYGAYLEYFIRNPKTAPLTKAPNLTLVHWDIGTRREILDTEKSQPYIDKATVLLHAVIKDHPGTPWAARADWELKRGFGVHLVPDYDGPHPQPTGPIIPVPKL